MSITDATRSMRAFREASRHLWNTYLGDELDIGYALDIFGQIQTLLFEAIVIAKMDSEIAKFTVEKLQVVPAGRTAIYIARNSGDNPGYWDAVKDMMIVPEEVTLSFLEHFDFFQPPVKDLHFIRCRIRSFRDRKEFEGREALIRASECQFFYNEDG